MEETDVREARFLREGVVNYNGRLMHWIDAIAEWLEEKLRRREKRVYVFNGGLSVSGLQHIGRLRGEVIIPDVLASILESKGFKIRRVLTLYTQDAWKGKDSQLAAFKNRDEAKKYTGWPLIKVPDPKGCHSNWVEHFWSEFGPYVNEFTRGQVETITTTELYSNKLRDFTRKVLKDREKVRIIINKYRGRKPYPPGWIPFEAICNRCGRIDSTEAINVENDSIEYVCRNCGFRGKASLSEGKLNWRIEWVGVWWALSVDFEPYGKDHAAPGGSRDSANELARALGVSPPEGIPYEWVSLREASREADMSSSDFIGFTPYEWLEVAQPEVYRFLVLKTPPMRKLTVGLREIPNYYSMYYQAERIYYEAETTGSKERDLLLKRSYELSYTRGTPPPRLPAQPPYTHIAVLVQLLPRHKLFEEALRRLQRTGHIASSPSNFDLERLYALLEKAEKWVLKYAPDTMRIQLVEELTEEIISKVSVFKEEFTNLANMLENIYEWNEENIKRAMIDFTREWPAEKRRRFYTAFYILFFNKESGPRAAPLLSLLDKNFVISRLQFQK